MKDRYHFAGKTQNDDLRRVPVKYFSFSLVLQVFKVATVTEENKKTKIKGDQTPKTYFTDC